MFKLLALSLALLGAPVWASGLPVDYEPPKPDTTDYVALKGGYRVVFEEPTSCGENCARVGLRIVDSRGNYLNYHRVDDTGRVLFKPTKVKRLDMFTFKCDTKPTLWGLTDTSGTTIRRRFSSEGLQSKVCRKVHPNGKDTARTIYLTTLCQFSDEPKKCVKEMQEAGHIE